MAASDKDFKQLRKRPSPASQTDQQTARPGQANQARSGQVRPGQGQARPSLSTDWLICSFQYLVHGASHTRSGDTLAVELVSILQYFSTGDLLHPYSEEFLILDLLDSVHIRRVDCSKFGTCTSTPDFEHAHMKTPRSRAGSPPPPLIWLATLSKHASGLYPRKEISFYEIRILGEIYLKDLVEKCVIESLSSF